MYSARENKLFAEICNGYGFEEIEHKTPDGIYCTGCHCVHKRPTKMYSNVPEGRAGREVLCKHQVIHLYEGGIDLDAS